MKVLILASNPRQDLRLDREIRDLKDAIRKSQKGEQFDVEDALAVQVSDLQDLLFRHRPQIVHFCGHGGGAPGLVFERENGGEQWVQAEALADLFRLFAKDIQCILLNACYSEEQANVIVNHIDYVIGMQQEIFDRASISFSKGFYRALGYECSIEKAFEFGKNAIQLEISGSSQVRSLEIDEVRKLQFVGEVIEQVAIPEHLKPILKKKATLLSDSAPAAILSPETQTVLQNEIAQSLAKASLPNSLSTYDAATWVGRDAIITDLSQKLQNGYRIIAITGITGIGKTALAERVVVEIYTDDQPFHRLNFDDRGQGRDFLSGALALLPKLGETVTTEDQKDPPIALRHLLQTLRQKPFLIQIDSLEMLLQGDEQTGWNAFTDPLWVDFFQQLLAGETCQSQLLLTSQALSEELEEIGARYPRSWYRQDLMGLSESEQLQLFDKYGLKPDGLGSDILKRFVEMYQGHPLVMQVIAKDILDKPFNGNVQQYWQRYQAEFEEVDRDRQRKGSSPRALQLRVKQRVEQSLQRLPEDARQMLCRSSVYRRSVPEEFWLAMMSDLPEERQWNALELLKSHSLVEQELRTDGFLLLRQHNLVRKVARELLRSDKDLWKQVEHTAAKVWFDSYQPVPDSSKLEEIQGKLEAFHHYCEVEDWETAQFVLINQGVGKQLEIWGYFRDLLPLYQQLLGKLDVTTSIECERRIANAYFFLGNYSDSINHYHQSLTSARKILARRDEGKALGGLGKVAHALGNYSQAIEYWEQFLTIARETGDSHGVGYALVGLGKTHYALGNYTEAIEYHQQDLNNAPQIGDRVGEGRALGDLGKVYHSLSNYPQAIEYYQKVLIVTREIGDRFGEGRALNGLGDSYTSLGNYSQAIEYHQQALAVACVIGDRQGEANALGGLSRIYYFLSNYPEAARYYQQALVIFQEIGDVQGEGRALGSLGNVFWFLGKYSDAIMYHQQALNIARQIGDRRGEAGRLGGLGDAFWRLGNYSQAIEYHQQALLIEREIGDRQGEACSLCNLGNAYKDSGNYLQALEYHQQDLAISREIGDRQGEGIALGCLSSVYLALKDYPQAIEHYHQALAIAREVGDRQGEAVALLIYSVILVGLEQYSEANAHLQTALKSFTELGDLANEAEALLRLGELHQKTGQLGQAQEFCSQALTIASNLGIPLIKECEALQSKLMESNF